MKTFAKMIALTLTCSAICVAADLPASTPATQASPHPRYQIVSSSEEFPWWGEQSPPEIIHPTCVAKVSLVTHTEDGRSVYNRLQSDTAALWVKQSGPQLPGLSDGQRAFLKQNVYTTQTYGVSNADGYAFFAVSEQDARQMAILFIDYLDGLAQKRLQEGKEHLQKALELLKTAPAQIDEYRAQGKQAADRIKALLGDQPEDAKAWNKAIDEGKAALRVLNIDRVGELARLQKIQQYMMQSAPAESARAPATQPNPAVQAALETMLVQINVEIAGTQAKRDAIEKEIASHRELLALQQAQAEIREKREQLSQRLSYAQSDVADMPRVLDNPPADMKPVQIKGNTIYIVPVKPAPTTNPAE